MKARVKATGEIIEVNRDSSSEYFDYLDVNSRILYKTEALEFIEEDFDYWTRLEHQYAGMAMQALLSSDTTMEILSRRDNGTMEEEVAREAFDYAHALVEKMKEERK